MSIFADMSVRPQFRDLNTPSGRSQSCKDVLGFEFARQYQEDLDLGRPLAFSYHIKLNAHN